MSHVHAEAIVVGTYNIRFDNPKDVESGNAWSQRAPVIASLIRFHEFDVLGAQEVYKNQLDDLQALLPGYAHYGCGRDDGREAGEYAPIFYKKKAFTFLEGGAFWLSDSPGKPSLGWDAKYVRICTWVKLEDMATGRAVYVFNTHFDHQGAFARDKSTHLVLKSIKEIAGDHPAILTGDFNFDQGSDSYKAIHDSGLMRSAFDSADERYSLNGTANGFKSNTYTDKRIDHVFHSRAFNVLRYGVLTDSYRMPSGNEKETGSASFPSEVKFKNYEARTPSDHFPILSEFEWSLQAGKVQITKGH